MSGKVKSSDTTKPKRLIRKPKTSLKQDKQEPVQVCESVQLPTPDTGVSVSDSAVVETQPEPTKRIKQTSTPHTSPTKVKNIISNYVLNLDATAAVAEIKDAKPKLVVVDGVETPELSKGVPLSELSEKTRDYITYAKQQLMRSKTVQYTKYKLALLSEPDRLKYESAKSDSSVKITKNKCEIYTDSDSFNLYDFNVGYDKDFYADFDKSPFTKPSDSEWKDAIENISKLNIRFSNTSRVCISAFMDYIIEQLVTVGHKNCVANSKQINLDHVISDVDEFPLYKILHSLHTFKTAKKHLADIKLLTESDNTEELKALTKQIDIFKFDSCDLDKQYQFRHVVPDLYESVKLKLESTESFTLSKIFKNFCSTIIYELLFTIGKMIKSEINSRNIKTVNGSVINVILSHIHTIYDIDELETNKYITKTLKTYHGTEPLAATSA